MSGEDIPRMIMLGMGFIVFGLILFLHRKVNQDIKHFPAWVRFSLAGVNSRKTAMHLFRLTIVSAIIVFLIGLSFEFDDVFSIIFLFCSILFIVAAFLYRFSIKWVDNNSEWLGA